MFQDNRPVEVYAFVWENGIEIGGALYVFTEISKFIVGKVLFLNLVNGFLLPVIPRFVKLRADWFFTATTSEIQEQTAEINRLIESIKSAKIDDENLAKIENFIAEFGLTSINSSQLETVFFSKSVIAVEGVKVDGKIISAVWDGGASINVLKSHPNYFREIGEITVQSYKNISRQKKFSAIIEINGKKQSIEYILDSQLPYDALISTKTLDPIAKIFDFDRREVVYR